MLLVHKVCLKFEKQALCVTKAQFALPAELGKTFSCLPCVSFLSVSFTAHTARFTSGHQVCGGFYSHQAVVHDDSWVSYSLILTLSTWRGGPIPHAKSSVPVPHLRGLEQIQIVTCASTMGSHNPLNWLD